MRAHRARTWIVTAALATGAAAGAAGVANAAGGSSGTTGSHHRAAPPAFAGGARPNPATMTHGPGETLLTGTAAAKARAAALAAVPGATVIRVETDSGSAVYEAHLREADGSYVTVEMDGSFHVTGTAQGFGPPPAGAPAP
jgi:hypothetical protein